MSEFLIQYNKDNCCEHKAVSVYIVSLLVPGCAVSLSVCVCVLVCVISNQSTSKKKHHVSHLSKLDALMHKTHIKVLSVDMCTSIVWLTKVARQRWCNHSFSQRNKTTEWTVEVGVGSNRDRDSSWTKFEKGGTI